MDRTEGQASTFRLAYAPGVTPSKWARTWTQRLPDVPLDLLLTSSADAVRLLRDGGVDAALIRLPVDADVLSAIPLYSEVSVVVVPVEHPIAAFESVTVVDLADAFDDDPVARREPSRQDEIVARLLPDDDLASTGGVVVADDVGKPPVVALERRPLRDDEGVLQLPANDHGARLAVA